MSALDDAILPDWRDRITAVLGEEGVTWAPDVPRWRIMVNLRASSVSHCHRKAF